MMKCRVFRSDRKNDTYLYVASATSFKDLPPELQVMFGEPVFVMSLELSADLKLARVDVKAVIHALKEQDFYLQLPPKIPTEEEITHRFS